MTIQIKQSTAVSNLLFLMVDSTDHVTGKTGLSPTVTISKNGAAFAAPTGAVTEVANGWYQVAANATDSNTLGPILLHATGAAADPTDIVVADVVANLESDTFGLFAGITSVAEWLGLLAGKQAGDATALTEIRATGAGSGTYDPTTDSGEALRDTAPMGTAMRGTDGANTTTPLTAAEVNAEVDTALNTAIPGGPTAGSVNDVLADLDARLPAAGTLSTFDETAAIAQPGQESPAASQSAEGIWAYLYKAWRNKSTQTSTAYKLYADDGTTVDQTGTDSDDTTTYTKGEIGTGP